MRVEEGWEGVVVVDVVVDGKNNLSRSQGRMTKGV